MKKIRIIALAMDILMLMQASAVAFDDKSMTQAEWDSLYAELRDENTLPTLCVGADETQLNLT